MNRRARRNAKRGRGTPGSLFSTGPRWTALGRGLSRRAASSQQHARGKSNPLLITALYTLAGLLCLALAAILVAAALTPVLPMAGGPPALRGELIWAAVLGALGVVLLGAAWSRLRSR